MRGWCRGTLTSGRRSAWLLKSSLVAEDGRALPDPFPERSGPDLARVRQELSLGEAARVDADRAGEELAPALGELLHEAGKRRTAVARDTHSVARRREADRLLREPHRDGLAGAERGGRYEERDGDAFLILEPGRQVDQHLLVRCHDASFRLDGESCAEAARRRQAPAASH